MDGHLFCVALIKQAPVNKPLHFMSLMPKELVRPTKIGCFSQMSYSTQR